jgi:hypothetical protein
LKEHTVTYEESAALMIDIAFRNRVKVACLKYADSISIEATNTPAHVTRLKWSQTCFQNPEMVAGQTTPPTVMDVQVQLDGADITDAALQASVQTVVNKMM